MSNKIGIRRESKNRWERRAPITPEHVLRLVNDYQVNLTVQPSDLRIFPTEEYREAGAVINEDLNDTELIMGIKEIPIEELEPGKAYMFFSHTIKGQHHNMPMLKRMMEMGCSLIDYEKIVDENNRRLIFFGWHAGAAGMIDTLWTTGRRLEWEGVRNPMSSIMKAHEYGDLPHIREHISSIGRLITTYGIPYSIRPLVIGFAGNGNVSKGAQEMLDLLPVKEVSPQELPTLKKRKDAGTNIYKVIFNEWDMVEPIDEGREFDLQDYYKNPEGYRTLFIDHVPYLTVLMNCIYWEERYPRLITKKDILDLYSDHRSPKLRVIGDISCDIDGAIQATIRATTPEDPVYVFDPWEDRAVPGWKGTGPVIMAVDNLPCEVPKESSDYFGERLKEFIPALAEVDLGLELDEMDLPKPLKNAFILHKGKLTPNFQYLKEPLEECTK
ncbi:MAG: bifunctional lysine ketoglutarate reductase /saccharopine dehydrogenase family protein [Candidatus Thermoplasmatota archaeon]|nr:bifunctional lysine ketoglutarate reductase /saccharopine dehydrogenase family protein [Candidatus Thermoplasmatota archaeon]